MLAFRFADDGQILGEWLGSKLRGDVAHLGWSFAPLGAVQLAP